MTEPVLNAHNKAEFPPAHTAEHLLNRTMVLLYGCPRSRNAHIERRKSKINYDLPRPLTPDEVLDVEHRICDLITADLPVTFEFLTRDDILARRSSSPLLQSVSLDSLPVDASETLRLVFIGDYDVCPCIGQHVTSTREIGLFRITSTSWTPSPDGVGGSFRFVFRVGADEEA